jgi:uncharacterized protein (TIGR04255 family)
MPPFNNKLPRAPLQEVVLDIVWHLDYNPDNNLFADKEFEKAALKFAALNKDSFSEVENLKQEFLPSIAYNNKPIFRFRKPEHAFPLYQLGPGIFSVNSNNEHYTWERFFELVRIGVNLLQQSYSKELIIKNLELRYIDSVQTNVLGECNKFEFLEKYLNIRAENYSFTEGALEEINFVKSFKINEANSLKIDIATGYNHQTMQECINWFTAIQCAENIKWNKFENWLDEAHTIASNTFRNMINQELYDYFARK